MGTIILDRQQHSAPGARSADPITPARNFTTHRAAPRLRSMSGCWKRVAVARAGFVLVCDIGALDRRSALERYAEARPCPLASSLEQA